ncbi:MAG: helical backbone metal receptor, partial [Bacteroidota bacterium]
QIIGGTKNVRVDRVRQLAPDLVIANKEENVREQVEAIAAFAPVWVTDVADVDGALAMIRDVGAATGRWPAADQLAQDIGDDFDTLSEAPLLRALYLIWRDPWMTVGDDTIIADVLRRGGFTNAAEGRTRYPSLSDDEFAALAPDVVLLSSEPYPFQDKHLDEVQALVPGVPVLLVDGEPFSWYGPRLAHAPAALRDIRQRLASRG